MSIKRTIIVTAAIVASVAMVAPAFAGATTVSDLMAQIAALQAQLQSLSGTPASGTGACAGVTFTRNLTVGSTGSDVKCLQVILNRSATTQVSATGAGAPGYETTTFGPKTLIAVRKYQAAKGFTPANQVGPMTRGALNAELGGGVINPPVGQTGPVSAMLASDNPPAGALIGSQAAADLLHVAFTGTGTVTSVTLQRSGASDQNLFTNVYLYDGNVRITDGYSFNANGQIVMNGLNIAVNGSHVISVRGDVMASASGTQGTAMVALTNYMANGSAVGANVAGNLMSVISGTLATLNFNAANTGAGGPSATPSVNAGTTAYTFWTQSINVSTRAVSLKMANFRMVGSAPSDALSNIKLYIDGVDTGKVGSVITISGSNYASFDLASAPISLSTGSHTIDVRADVQKGSNRTVQLSVQQAADLTVYDAQIGVNIAVGTSGAGVLPSSGGTVTISTGSVTVSNDSTFQQMTNITGGSSNTTIAKFKVHAYGEDVKVNTLYVAPVLINAANGGTDVTGATGICTTGSCGLQNVTVYFNGSQVGSQLGATVLTTNDAGYKTFTMGSQLIIPAGVDSTIEVKADLRTTGGTNWTSGTVSADLYYVASNAQGQNSLNTLSVPATATVVGHTLALQTGTLGISKAAGYGSQTAGPNQTGLKIGSFVLQNTSTSESVRITSLVVNLAYGAGTSSTNLGALRTSETSGSGSQPQQPATAAASNNANNTFSVDTTLGAGAIKTIDIFADSSSDTGATATVISSLNVSYIGVSSGVSTSTGSTAGQTITFGSGTLAVLPTVNINTSTPASYVAAFGGATDGARYTFNLTATSGSATISELKFDVVGTTTGISQVKVGSVSAPVISGRAWLTGLNLVVPNAGAGLDVDAYATYGDVSINGILSGSTAHLDLSYVKYSSGGSTKTLCSSGIGGCDGTLAGSGTTSVGVTGNTMTLVGSKPSVTLTLPNGASGTSQTGLSVATIYVADVKVTADSRGAIKVNTIKVTFKGNDTGTHVNGASTVVKDANGTTISSASVTASDGNDSDTTSTVTFAGGYTVTGTQTFKIYAVVTALQAATGGDSVATGVDAAGFTWTDSTGNGTASAGAGTLTTNFPDTSVSTRTN